MYGVLEFSFEHAFKAAVDLELAAVITLIPAATDVGGTREHGAGYGGKQKK